MNASSYRIWPHFGPQPAGLSSPFGFFQRGGLIMHTNNTIKTKHSNHCGFHTCCILSGVVFPQFQSFLPFWEFTLAWGNFSRNYCVLTIYSIHYTKLYYQLPFICLSCSIPYIIFLQLCVPIVQICILYFLTKLILLLLGSFGLFFVSYCFRKKILKCAALWNNGPT